jgi:hypothetical protein
MGWLISHIGVIRRERRWEYGGSSVDNSYMYIKRKCVEHGGGGGGEGRGVCVCDVTLRFDNRLIKRRRKHIASIASIDNTQRSTNYI